MEVAANGGREDIELATGCWFVFIAFMGTFCFIDKVAPSEANAEVFTGLADKLIGVTGLNAVEVNEGWIIG